MGGWGGILSASSTSVALIARADTGQMGFQMFVFFFTLSSAEGIGSYSAESAPFSAAVECCAFASRQNSHPGLPHKCQTKILTHR